MPSPPPDLLAGHAASRADHPAVIADGSPPRVWSFAELNREANRLGNALLALGVRPGETVLWCGMNSPGLVRMMHAARRPPRSIPLNYRRRPRRPPRSEDRSRRGLRRC